MNSSSSRRCGNARPSWTRAPGCFPCAVVGGLGTCEELFEVEFSRYLGRHGKPAVLLDPDDHYEGLIRWAVELQSPRVRFQVALDALVVARTVEEALDACAIPG